MIDFKKERLTKNSVINFLLNTFNMPYILIASSSVFNFQKFIYKEPILANQDESTLFSLAQLLCHYINKDYKTVYSFLNFLLRNLTYTAATGNFQKIIKALIDKSLANFGYNNVSTYRQFKNEGFNYDLIKNLICKNTPILLTLDDDGRQYYTQHSVVIVGYAHYRAIRNGQEGKLLKVVDGLSQNKCEYSYIDYDCLSRICFINFVK